MGREYETSACGREFSTNVDIVSSYERGRFPDPWFDYATLDLPRTMADALRYGTRLWYANGVYRSAMERIAGFFITDLEIDAESDSVKEKYEDYFRKINYRSILSRLSCEYVALNNCFTSVSAPFKRFLVCPRCNARFPLDKVDFEWTGEFKFVGRCSACKSRTAFERRDSRLEGADDVMVVHVWNPLQMFMEYNRYANRREFYYQLPGQDVEAIRQGKRIMLEYTPWELVETARDAGKNRLFRFNEGSLFYMSDPPLSTMDGSGWGMPRFLAVARQAFLSQVQHRASEALALDYIIPKRFLCPDTANPLDAAQAVNLGILRQTVLGMMANHRKDPAAIDFLPIPIKQVAFGGEGMTPVPHEMLAASNREILESLGVPPQIQLGDLQAQAAPMMLRLFQQTFDHVPSQLNGWCQWTANKIAKLKNWPLVTATLRPSTMADDVERKNILLQLASASKVSDATALELIQIDPQREEKRIRDEARRRVEAEREQAREDAKVQETEQLIEQYGQQPQGGQPMGGMGGMPMGPPSMGGAPMGMMGSVPTSTQGAMSVQDLLAQAEQKAQQLLQMPESARRSELINLKRHDEYMHALVKSKMDTLRSQAQTQGGNMLMQGQM